MKILLTFLIKM